MLAWQRQEVLPIKVIAIPPNSPQQGLNLHRIVLLKPQDDLLVGKEQLRKRRSGNQSLYVHNIAPPNHVARLFTEGTWSSSGLKSAPSKNISISRRTYHTSTSLNALRVALPIKSLLTMFVSLTPCSAGTRYLSTAVSTPCFGDDLRSVGEARLKQFAEVRPGDLYFLRVAHTPFPSHTTPSVRAPVSGAILSPFSDYSRASPVVADGPIR